MPPTICVAKLPPISRITTPATTKTQAEYRLNRIGNLLISDQEPAQQIKSSYCCDFQDCAITCGVKAPILCLGTTVEPSGAVAQYKRETSDQMLRRIVDWSDQSHQYILQSSIFLVSFRPPIAAFNLQAVSLSELTLASTYDIQDRLFHTHRIRHSTSRDINGKSGRKHDG